LVLYLLPCDLILIPSTFESFLAGSSAAGCWIGNDCDWVNSCRLCLSLRVRFWTSPWFNSVRFSCLISSELARALTNSFVSDLDLESLDPSPVVLVVLVAQPAFWAAEILPQLFSRATALVN
jgi:hypothetical protein